MNKLHLIEPTLFDQTGHGFSYNSSIIQANNSKLFSIEVWIDKRGKDIFKNLPCKTHLYFYRSIRRLQNFFLYYKLLKQQNIIYICTAELSDLIILSWLCKKTNNQAKIFLHFHQFNKKPSKLKSLSKIAKHNKHFYIFTPTNKLTQIFISNGFTNCITIPCPSFHRAPINIDETRNFSKVLYAGAARQDKGFSRVVDLIIYLQQKHINILFEIQISPPNSGKYDTETLNAISKLESIKEENLILHRQTLNQKQYQELFDNSICLLIYDAQNYHNKFSGVTLDAFYAGCPIITVNDTWMGDTVKRFNAGIVLDNTEPDNLLNAINEIKNNYGYYSLNAAKASIILKKEHDPINTLIAIKNQID